MELKSSQGVSDKFVKEIKCLKICKRDVIGHSGGQIYKFHSIGLVGSVSILTDQRWPLKD